MNAEIEETSIIELPPLIDEEKQEAIVSKLGAIIHYMRRNNPDKGGIYGLADAKRAVENYLNTKEMADKCSSQS